MTGRDAFEAMSGISDKLIMEAGDKLGILNAGVVKSQKVKAPSAFSRFINSGWGVAAVCALVAVGVMGGIIWAGNQPGTHQPAGHPAGKETEAEASEALNPGETEPENVLPPEDETQTESESTSADAGHTFDAAASLTAIDQLASQNVSISLKYHTTPYGGLPQEFNGFVGQAGGKHWAYVNTDGAAVLEEGGYYHKYVYDMAKFWYLETYTMTDNDEFDRVYEGRYWWKNYLDQLTFEAYDALVYTGTASVAEQACDVFSYNGTVTDGSQVEMTLYVRISDRNVMKLEVKIIQSSHSSHLSTDAREAVIEIERISTGDAAKGPTLPDPKWDGPDQDVETEIEYPPEVNPPEEPETGGTVFPDVIPELDDLMAAPLVSADDTESFVRIPYLSQGMGGLIEFFVLPKGASDASELVSTYGCAFPEDSETNLLVVGVEKSATEYCILYLMEKSGVTEINGIETRYVEMLCTEMIFLRDKTLSPTGTTYYRLQNTSSAGFQYTDQQRESILAFNRHDSLNALTHAEDLLDRYKKATDYKYTVIYSYSNQSAEELAMAHIPELPEFNFEIFREYGLPDRDK